MNYHRVNEEVSLGVYGTNTALPPPQARFTGGRGYAGGWDEDPPLKRSHQTINRKEHLYNTHLVKVVIHLWSKFVD